MLVDISPISGSMSLQRRLDIICGQYILCVRGDNDLAKPERYGKLLY